MPVSSLLTQRFKELSVQAVQIEGTKRYERDGYIDGWCVDENALLNWAVKVRNLLVSACGRESEHFVTWKNIETTGTWSTNYSRYQNLKAVFEAAQEDHSGGYLKTVKSLVQAEVFSSELEQALELLNSGYKAPAAVVSGIVLETAIREMCQDRGIPLGKLDKMNADLAKAGAYNTLVQKRITGLAAVRNSAAHGHPDQFTDADVRDLISYTEQFLGDRL